MSLSFVHIQEEMEEKLEINIERGEVRAECSWMLSLDFFSDRK